ncbi:MAG: alpha/beta hydrolase [Candidatus Acidiferrales bacterium]
MYWMISDRNIPGGTSNPTPANFGTDRGPLTYWTNSQGPATSTDVWKLVQSDDFEQQLRAIASQFPPVGADGDHQNQKHITLFVHGYKNKWLDEAERYQQICNTFFTGPNSLGECVLYDWPSYGEVYDYLPDRAHARDCANDLATILSALYDIMQNQEQLTQRAASIARASGAAVSPNAACRAKTSIIAHSMGNYLLQEAMVAVWARKNQPLTMSLVNQLLMIAADVDNDLFKSGETVEQTDGDAIANLTYRITALYSGLDPVLGLSAGLKHFGKRRLGRSGIDHDFPVPDNAWDVDCSAFFKKNNAKDIHSAYFGDPNCQTLIRSLLQGTDRTILVQDGEAPRPFAKDQLV